MLNKSDSRLLRQMARGTSAVTQAVRRQLDEGLIPRLVAGILGHPEFREMYEAAKETSEDGCVTTVIFPHESRLGHAFLHDQLTFPVGVIQNPDAAIIFCELSTAHVILARAGLAQSAKRELDALAGSGWLFAVVFDFGVGAFGGANPELRVLGPRTADTPQLDLNKHSSSPRPDHGSPPASTHEEALEQEIARLRRELKTALERVYELESAAKFAPLPAVVITQDEINRNNAALEAARDRVRDLEERNDRFKALIGTAKAERTTLRQEIRELQAQLAKGSPPQHRTEPNSPGRLRRAKRSE